MKIRINDKNNDWMFGNSLLNYYIDNDKGVAQKIKTKILEWYDDCFFNATAGIDYRTRLGFKGQQNLLVNDIRRIIASVEEVVLINSLDTDINDRSISINYSVYHIFSSQLLQEVVTIQGV